MLTTRIQATGLGYYVDIYKHNKLMLTKCLKTSKEVELLCKTIKALNEI